MSNDQVRDWAGVVTFMLNIPYSVDINDGRDLIFSDEARALFDDYRIRCEEALRPFGELDQLAAWGNRLTGTVARQAGLLHMLACAEAKDTHPWNTRISGATMAAAIEFGNCFKDHAQIFSYQSIADSAVWNAQKI